VNRIIEEQLKAWKKPGKPPGASVQRPGTLFVRP